MRDSRRYVLSRSARRLPSHTHNRDGESLDTTALRKLIQSTDTTFVDSLLGKPHHTLPTFNSTLHPDTLPTGKRLRRIPRPCIYIVMGMMLMYGILYFWEQRHHHQWWKWYRYQLNAFQMTPDTIALNGGRPVGQQQQQQQDDWDEGQGGGEMAQPIMNHQNQGYAQGNHHTTNQIMSRNSNNNNNNNNNAGQAINPTFDGVSYGATSRRTTNNNNNNNKNNNGNTNTHQQRIEQLQVQGQGYKTNNNNGNEIGNENGNNRFKNQPTNAARITRKTNGGTTQTQMQSRSSNTRIAGGLSSTTTNAGRMAGPVAPVNNVFVGDDSGRNQGNRALAGGRIVTNPIATESIQGQLDMVNNQLRSFQSQSQSAQQPGFLD